MRTNNFWKALVLSAAMLMTGVGFTSCDKNEELADFEAEISTDQTSQNVEPGQEITIKVTSNTNWTASVTDTKGILTLSKTSGKKGNTSVVATIAEDAASHSTATVTFTAMGKIFGIEWPATASITFTVGGSAEGTLEDPLSCADAIAKAQEAGISSDGANALGPFYIKGIISKVATSFADSGNYGNANFYMKDDLSDANDFYAYQVYYLGNRQWVNGDTEVKVGDEVIIYGKVYNYVGSNGGDPTPETTGKGSAYIYSLNGVTDGGEGGGNQGGGVDSADITAGEYYMFGVANGKYYAWDGNEPYNGQLQTQEYTYNADTKTYTIGTKDSNAGTAAKISLVSAGDNAFYIKSGENYLYTTAAENHKLAFTTTAGSDTEWTFSSFSKGGILGKQANGMCLGTSTSASSRFIRSMFESSLGYGIELVPADSVTIDNEEGSGGNQGGDEDPADITAGEYYMFGVVNGKYYAWDGNEPYSGQLQTQEYTYNADTKTYTIGTKDSYAGTAAKISLVSAGDDTFYIKSGDNYLYSTEAANHKLAFTTTAGSNTEWTFSSFSKGGLVGHNNGVNLGTSTSATSRYIRAFANENSLGYGIELVPANSVTIDNGTSGGEGGGGGTTDPDPNPNPGKGGVDVLNNAFTGVGNVTNYTDWSGKVGTSGAVYAGRSAGDKNSIQLRTTNSTEGVVTTASGGKVTKIAVKWNSGTNSARVLDVYAKTSAYSTAADLYKTDTQGTLVGSIKIADGSEGSLDITGDYTYIGFRSNNGALYLDEVEITWAATE